MKSMVTLLIIGAMFALGACQQKKTTTTVKPSTENDKIFFAMGNMMGSRLKRLELNDQEINMIQQGLRASVKGEEFKELTSYRRKIQGLVRKRMQKASVKVKEEGDKFVKDFMGKGGKSTASGIGYKVLKAGSGKRPSPTDTVEVHYHGTLINGTVFDSSVQRKKKVSFPLNRVIKCWTEGMQLIGVGGKIKLVCPSKLAYGDHGAPPKIPGGATLVFEVELFSVKKGKPKAARPSLKKGKRKFAKKVRRAKKKK